MSRDDSYSVRCLYTYRREAFALLVSINWAMREPLTVKRATSDWLHAFLFMSDVKIHKKPAGMKSACDNKQ